MFVLHFHQPYGNLERIFADATDRCYLPTLDLLIANPHVRTGIHVSGTLLQWLIDRRPKTIDKLRTLTTRGQIEILGGGLEEPVLTMLPERDALGQLIAMADLCEEALDVRPRGMWLAERVWEPDLPRIIAAAGYRYTLLDDAHLFAAGAMGRPQGYYVTERAGSALAVFPIDRELRARIPFADIDALLLYLYGARGEALTYGDDVEKFGLWPTTAKRVWRDRWLEHFFTAMREHAEWLRPVVPSMVLPDQPSGLVYLPSISYTEMNAWSLPAEAAARLSDVNSRIDRAGLRDEAEPFVRGGIWQGALAKYPESRRLYRKMLRVSQMVDEAQARGDEVSEAARAALYRGQSNCAYWHGLFGGLYLQHLRSATMSTLLEAETILSPATKPTVTVADHDADFFEEVLLEAPHANVYIAPRRGGSVFELDLRGPRFNLTDVLGQRFEVYHRDVPKARVIPEDDLKAIAAHDIVRAMEPNLVDKLKVDTYERGAFIDHLLPAGADIRSLMSGIYAPLVNLPATPYSIEVTETSASHALVALRGECEGVVVHKEFGVDGDHEIAVRYEVGADGPRSEVAFGCEFGFTLLGADTADGRRIEIIADDDSPIDHAPGATSTTIGVRGIRIIGEAIGIDLAIEVDPPAELWRFPLEAVMKTERGFEASYQGTVLAFIWRGEIGGGATIRSILRCEVIGSRPA